MTPKHAILTAMLFLAICGTSNCTGPVAANSNGMQMLYIPVNGHIQAVPLSVGKAGAAVSSRNSNGASAPERNSSASADDYDVHIIKQYIKTGKMISTDYQDDDKKICTAFEEYMNHNYNEAIWRCTIETYWFEPRFGQPIVARAIYVSTDSQVSSDVFGDDVPFAAGTTMFPPILRGSPCLYGKYLFQKQRVRGVVFDVIIGPTLDGINFNPDAEKECNHE